MGADVLPLPGSKEGYGRSLPSKMEASTRNVVAFISTLLCCLMQIGTVNSQGLSGLANSLGSMLLSGLDEVLDDGCKHSCPNGKVESRLKDGRYSLISSRILGTG